jgi:hypothetical protein
VNVVRRLNLTFKRSGLIRNIETSKRKLLKASDEEKIRYELELKAYRQQVRLLDGMPHA